MNLENEQAKIYLKEAKNTLKAAILIMKSGTSLWANVVKNAYDAIEQAISAAIAKKGEIIPKEHPAKVTKFIELYNLYHKDIAKELQRWSRLRSRAQYVDVQHGKIFIPSKFFKKNDAERILKQAENIIDYVEKLITR